MRSFWTWLWDSPADDGTTARQRLAAHRKIQKERPYYNAKDVLRYLRQTYLWIPFAFFVLVVGLGFIILAFHAGQLAYRDVAQIAGILACIAWVGILANTDCDVVFYKWLFKERMLNNCCQRCNYDMRFSDRCPECGVTKENVNENIRTASVGTL